MFLVALLFLSEPDAFSSYAIGACIVTFAIGLMLPFAVTEIAALDVDGRYVVLSVPAIGIGAMTGPAVAGMLTQAGSYTPLLLFGATMIVVACLLILIAARLAAQRSAIETR